MKPYYTNHENLMLLTETEMTLPVEDISKFANLLLGALSVEVDPDTWKAAIETCVTELRRVNAKR